MARRTDIEAYEPLAGTSIGDAVSTVVHRARYLGIPFNLCFNGLHVVVLPYSRYEDIMLEFDHHYEVLRSHAEGVKSQIKAERRAARARTVHP